VIILAATCLPRRYRLRGPYLWVAVCLCVLTCGAGVVCAAAGFFK